jgi:hypothetical protein
MTLKRGPKSDAEEFEDLRKMKIGVRSAAWVIGMAGAALRQKTDVVPDRNNKYSMEDLIEYVHAKKNKKSEVEENSVDAQKKKLEIRKLENQVREQEAKFLKDQALLVDREEFLKQLRNGIDSLKSLGEEIGRKGTITGKQAQAMINSTLARMARDLREK